MMRSNRLDSLLLAVLPLACAEPPAPPRSLTVRDVPPEVIAELDRGEPRLVQELRGERGEGLGSAIALDGDRLVVGAVNGDAAHVFERTDSGWVESAKLVPAPLEREARAFGGAVALSGDIVVVGDTGESIRHLPGSAHVFELTPDGWRRTEVLLPSDSIGRDFFGDSVAIEGERILVGAPGARERQGAAYVFQRDGSSWREVQRLGRPGARPSEFLGEAVALSGDHALVGASTDDAGINSGSALLFRRKGRGFSLVAELTPHAGGELGLFGEAVALDGDRVFVGAHQTSPRGKRSGSAHVFHPGEEEAMLVASDGVAESMFGTALDASGARVVVGAAAHRQGGSAYLYERSSAGWVEVARLSGSSAVDGFGSAVAIEGDVLVVGAPWDDYGAPDAGAVYVYER